MKLSTRGGDELFPVALAGHSDTRPRMVDAAIRRGVNAFFFYNLTFEGIIAGLRQAASRKRDSLFIASGTESRDAAAMREAVTRTLGELRTDYLDVFFAEYCAPSEPEEAVFGNEGALETLATLRDEGVICYRGVSVHNRDLALRLIQSGRADVVMHRYNVAHRKCESRVLPAALEAGAPVVAFTCTRWGSLMKGHPGWDGPVPRAGDCYRAVLAHPAVQLALMAPAKIEELDENLDCLDEGPPSDGDLAAWRAYGALVYGEGTDAFETRWP